MAIRIVSDSTCDLPESVLCDYGISIIPCFINFGEQSFLDNVEMTRPEFYDRLRRNIVFPKTSAPSIGLFKEFYAKVAGEGVEEILSIHIHHGLSNMSNVARLAADAMQSVKVTVLEVGQVALGLGFLVAEAARAALQGKTKQEIIKILNDRDHATNLLAAIDSTAYLKHSGRIPNLLVDLAGLLNIKPILLLHDGKISLTDRARTTTQQIEAIIKRTMKLSPLAELGVIHANAFEKAEELSKTACKALDFSGKTWIIEATPVLGVHVGPGAFGLACVSKQSHS